MATPETFLLIADLRGSIVERCEPGPPVHGELWLRRHDSQVVMYWKVWEAPYEEDGTRRGQGGFADIRGVVARRSGLTRWQSLLLLTPARLPAEVKDLPTAFADPTMRDILLRTALQAINGEIYLPLVRGRFTAASYRWREGREWRLA